MKLAIVHDHLIQAGGAEKVLAVLQQIWPQAPTYTLLYQPENLGQVCAKHEIKTSFLQHWPGALKHYQWFLPFMPLATESYDLFDYDVVISSCSALAKGVITGPQSVHICYCHTPTRYLWSDTHRYIEELKYNWLIKKIAPYFLSRLRSWDQLAAQRVDVFVANSNTVAARIAKYYHRDSVVIYPPVDTNSFFVSDKIDKYFLTGGRLVAYKRFDLVIKAFNRLGIPLKIFGAGPEFVELKKLAKNNIEFVGNVTTAELAKLYSHAQAFINPQLEDFGITPVEAMASGRPVIAYRAGGACETVVDNKTGKFFDEQSWEALADCVVRFKPENFNSAEIKLHANQFSTQRFVDQITALVETERQKRNNQQAFYHL